MKEPDWTDLKLLERFPFPVWRSGRDAQRDDFNRAWLAFTGRTSEQERGDGWTVGVHPDDLEALLHRYREAFEARRPLELEYRLRRHDGQYRWVVDREAPFVDEGGLSPATLAPVTTSLAANRPRGRLPFRHCFSTKCNTPSSPRIWTGESPSGTGTPKRSFNGPRRK